MSSADKVFVEYIKHLTKELRLLGYIQSDYALYPFPIEGHDMNKQETEVELCTVCTKPVLIQIQKGSGICSENCKKATKGEPPTPQVLAMGAI